MNAPLLPETLLPLQPDPPQSGLGVDAEGTQRHVWESRFGAMLIEVIGGEMYVNGQRVVPAIRSPGRNPHPARTE